MNFLGILGTQELFLIFIFFGIFLLPVIFFLVTQQNTLKAIRPENRSMAPGEVWLQLIPLFGLIWQFMVVTKIAESIQKDLSDETSFSFEENAGSRHNSDQPRPTYGIGMAYCTLFCLTIIPFIGRLASLVGLVCWIIYCVRLSDYKNRIQTQRRSGSYS
jgi:hypothetical protein